MKSALLFGEKKKKKEKKTSLHIIRIDDMQLTSSIKATPAAFLFPTISTHVLKVDKEISYMG